MTGGSLSATSSFQYVGYAGTGTFIQSGGGNSISSEMTYDGYNPGLYLGYNPGSSGTYTLSGTGLLSATAQYVGYSGTGSFTQSGGTNSLAYNGGAYFNAGLYLGYNADASGTYNLNGASQLLGTSFEFVGYSGTGNFTQSGGTNSLNGGSFGLYLGYTPGSSGTYILNGRGLLSVPGMYVGFSGTGNCTQSGGTNTVSGNLYLGYSPAASGTYSLGGTGQLSAQNEYVGYDPSSTALFQQTSGLNSATYVPIGSGSRYNFSGGTLQISGGLSNQGVFDGLGGAGCLSAANSCILDFSNGTLQNVASISVSVGANSLVIIPAGFERATQFGSYTSLGFTHTAGTTLVVPAGQGFGGWGAINDPVNCQGTISAAPSGSISLNNGLAISGSGTVSLGDGNLTTNDAISGMSGGALSANNIFVGNCGIGVFNHSGGICTAGLVYLGYNPSDRGTYFLNGTGQLSAYWQYVGYSGTGTFTQSGGSNSANDLYLGYNAGGSGTYSLSGNGVLSTGGEIESVGYSGIGTFTQSGGTNNAGGLDLGVKFGSSGTYSLSGSGQLSSYSQYVGCSGTGSFTQSGGTNCVSGLYLGSCVGGSGTYSLTKRGQLWSGVLEVGNSGTGTFSQSGGSNSITYYLYLGNYAGSSGTYCLGGTAASLSAASEYVGYAPRATALFQQNDGTNTAKYLCIGSGGQYQFSGGTLQINGGLSNQGVFDGAGGTGCLIAANSILDFSAGTLQNLASTSVTIGANSLVIVAPGFNPAAVFGGYTSAALTHTAGTTLVVPAGQGFGGWGAINDPVDCQGTIMASSGGTINVNGGLTISGTGVVSLGGNLTTNDMLSGMTGGSLSVAWHCVGIGGTGQFTQSGGSNCVGGLVLGAALATAVRTTSVEAVCCSTVRIQPFKVLRVSTWAAPARGTLFSPAEPTLPAALSCSAGFYWR